MTARTFTDREQAERARAAAFGTTPTTPPKTSDGGRRLPPRDPRLTQRARRAAYEALTAGDDL